MAQYFASLFSVPPALVPVFQSIATVWGYVWWIVVPVVTGMVFWEAWLIYLAVEWHHSIKWNVLEIKVPKNNLKTPKAMEQIFAAAHAPYSYGIRFWDKYWKGIHESYFIFELIGKAGETHFYLHTPEQFRNMMESAIYGQYPEAEIVEVEDHVEQMPHVLPNKELDVAGFEEILGNPDPYPIRTYPSFEDPTEERRVDTIGAFVEALSKMKDDQQFWFQLIIEPTGEDFRKEGEEIINKIMGLEKKEEKKASAWPSLDLGFSVEDVVRAPFEHPGTEPREKEKKEEKRDFTRFLMSPVDKERTEGIQTKIAKFGFETTIRFLTVYNRSEGKNGERAVFLAHGYIRQFNTQHMNALRPDRATTSASYAVRGLFKKTRLNWRKRLLYERYRYHVHNEKHPVLNIEELATLYHFPIAAVSTSELEKVESRKGTPPASLPVVE